MFFHFVTVLELFKFVYYFYTQPFLLGFIFRLLMRVVSPLLPCAKQLFVDTQLFSVHTDLVLSFFQKEQGSSARHFENITALQSFNTSSLLYNFYRLCMSKYVTPSTCNPNFHPPSFLFLFYFFSFRLSAARVNNQLNDRSNLKVSAIGFQSM